MISVEFRGGTGEGVVASRKELVTVLKKYEGQEENKQSNLKPESNKIKGFGSGEFCCHFHRFRASRKKSWWLTGVKETVKEWGVIPIDIDD